MGGTPAKRGRHTSQAREAHQPSVGGTPAKRGRRTSQAWEAHQPNPGFDLRVAGAPCRSRLHHCGLHALPRPGAPPLARRVGSGRLEEGGPAVETFLEMMLELAGDVRGKQLREHLLLRNKRLRLTRQHTLQRRPHQLYHVPQHSKLDRIECAGRVA